MIRSILLYFCLIMLGSLFVPSQLHAAPNPFISRPAPSHQKDAGMAEQRSPQAVSEGMGSLVASFMQTIINWQVQLRFQMTSMARAIQKNPTGPTFWLFILFSFAYGMVHAAGPGHGKLFAASWFLNRSGPPWMGFAFGYLSMFFHVLSAATLVLLGRFVLQVSAGQTVDNWGAKLEYVSYGALLLLGIYLCFSSLSDLRRAHASRSSHAPGCCIPCSSPRNGSSKSMLLATMAAGLIPCPGAALILIFSISIGILQAGLMALLAISLGMGLTISLCATLVILFKETLLIKLATHSKLATFAITGLPLAGGLLMAAISLILLWGKLFT